MLGTAVDLPAVPEDASLATPSRRRARRQRYHTVCDPRGSSTSRVRYHTVADPHDTVSLARTFSSSSCSSPTSTSTSTVTEPSNATSLRTTESPEGEAALSESSDSLAADLAAARMAVQKSAASQPSASDRRPRSRSRTDTYQRWLRQQAAAVESSPSTTVLLCNIRHCHAAVAERLTSQFEAGEIVRFSLEPQWTFGFVEMCSADAAIAAVGKLNQLEVDGVRLMAERTLAMTPGSNPKVFDAHPSSAELVLKNLPFTMIAGELRTVLEDAGVKPKSVSLRADAGGHATGAAFVSFASQDAAAIACQQISGLALDGRLIRAEFRRGDNASPQYHPPTEECGALFAKLRVFKDERDDSLLWLRTHSSELVMTVAGTVSALARRQLKAMRDVLDFKFECEPFEDRISGETVLRLWKPASSNGNAAAAALAHAKKQLGPKRTRSQSMHIQSSNDSDPSPLRHGGMASPLAREALLTPIRTSTAVSSAAAAATHSTRSPNGITAGRSPIAREVTRVSTPTSPHGRTLHQTHASHHTLTPASAAASTSVAVSVSASVPAAAPVSVPASTSASASVSVSATSRGGGGGRGTAGPVPLIAAVPLIGAHPSGDIPIPMQHSSLSHSPVSHSPVQHSPLPHSPVQYSSLPQSPLPYSPLAANAGSPTRRPLPNNPPPARSHSGSAGSSSAASTSKPGSTSAASTKTIPLRQHSGPAATPGNDAPPTRSYSGGAGGHSQNTAHNTAHNSPHSNAHHKTANNAVTVGGVETRGVRSVALHSGNSGGGGSSSSSATGLASLPASPLPVASAASRTSGSPRRAAGPEPGVIRRPAGPDGTRGFALRRHSSSRSATTRGADSISAPASAPAAVASAIASSA